MHTLYKINANELNENFIVSVKAQFQHKEIEISICETRHTEQDETNYLLHHPANKARLLDAMDNIKNSPLVTISLDDLQCCCF